MQRMILETVNARRGAYSSHNAIKAKIPRKIPRRMAAWCVLSFEAVARLRKAGLEARQFEDGLPQWQRAGLPVNTN